MGTNNVLLPFTSGLEPQKRTGLIWNASSWLQIMQKNNVSAVEEITTYSKRIVELFHQTKDYASGWNSKHKEKRRLSTEDYTEATDESWDALDKWTVSQEKLRQSILEFMELLYSVVSKP